MTTERKNLRGFSKRARELEQEPDIEKRNRMRRELITEYRKPLVNSTTKRLERDIADISRKVMEGEPEPNIARCVLAAFEELKNIGDWDGSENTTYSRAIKAMEEYEKMEKKRIAFLSTKAAYEKASFDYGMAKVVLGQNLVYKLLQPLQGGHWDPMDWYWTAQEIAKRKLCFTTTQDNKPQEVHLSVATIRKYQRLGLIPKPIRIGRQARYSLLTIMRLKIIQVLKTRGVKVKDMDSAQIQDSLKATLKSCSLREPNYEEMAYGSMQHLTNAFMESIAIEFWARVKARLSEQGDGGRNTSK